MAIVWQDLSKSSPHELRISGPKHAKQIEDEKGLNELVYKLETLNFLEVSKTSIDLIASKIKLLNNLTCLMLYENKLTNLPKEIGLLSKLKTLDISSNQIETLPVELGKLKDLQSFNLMHNKVKELPSDLSNWENLVVIKFSYNQFEKFPQGLCSPTFSKHLTEIHASDNAITNMPCQINHLSSLKHLDLSNNKIEHIPGELGDCSKIKLLMLQNNPIKDVRLHKMAEKNPTKQIMQYIAKNLKKGGDKVAGSRKKAVSTSSDKSNVEDEEEAAQVEVSLPDVKEPQRSTKNSLPQVIGIVKIAAVDPEKWFIIEADSDALNERKIVACILKNVKFEDDKDVKKFLTLQTNLHDTVCGRRELATIATHDMAKIVPRVKMIKKLPHKILITPLNRGKQMTGQELYKLLNQEAEAYRKEKKRNNYSGIHKYLYMLKGKTHYCVVQDGNDVPITLPPLTNAEATRINPSTQNVLVEVTGAKTTDCRMVLDTLLEEMLKLKICLTSHELSKLPTIEVEPVRVVRKDEDEKLFVVYPSKVDLRFPHIMIEREIDGNTI